MTTLFQVGLHTYQINLRDKEKYKTKQTNAEGQIACARQKLVNEKTVYLLYCSLKIWAGNIKQACMIEYIRQEDQLYAIVIRSNYTRPGIEFFTPKELSQQLGYMNRPKGYKIEPHVHRHIERSVNLAQEVMMIRSGRVQVNLFDAAANLVNECILEKGDVMLVVAGGHGVKMLEDSEIISIKQGPYSETDKIFLPNEAQ